jgi:hypothetical protein
MRIDTENNFYFAIFLFHGNSFAMKWRRQTMPKDRTLTVQDKAPIRSLAAGSALPRWAPHPTDRSTQRQYTNPSTGQAGSGARADRRLSVPTISTPAHGRRQAVFLEDISEVEAGVLAAAIAVEDHPRPDGHFKFLHLWPLKLPQAGWSNYASVTVSAMREVASLRR